MRDAAATCAPQSGFAGRVRGVEAGVTSLSSGSQTDFTFPRFPVLVRGGGDLGSGVAHRVARAGFPVVIAEVAAPLAVRLGASFAQAVWEGEAHVDGLTARRVPGPDSVQFCWRSGAIPVVIAAEFERWDEVSIAAVVDARMLKRAGDPIGAGSPLTVGLGPGFRAGTDCHAVVETQRGHWLGRVYWRGGASDDSGVPDAVHGRLGERVVRAPTAGVIRCIAAIGDPVRAGVPIAEIDGTPIRAAIDGVVRGLIHDGVAVSEGLKIGDIDPRGLREHCFTISDKALAVGGGALAAILESIQFRHSLNPGGRLRPPASTEMGQPP